MRAVDEGLSTGAELEVETIGAVSETSADVLEAGSNLACFSAGRRIRFFDLGVLASMRSGPRVSDSLIEGPWLLLPPTARGLREKICALQGGEWGGGGVRDR